jgi:hypothetical protein
VAVPKSLPNKNIRLLVEDATDGTERREAAGAKAETVEATQSAMVMLDREYFIFEW